MSVCVSCMWKVHADEHDLTLLFPQCGHYSLVRWHILFWKSSIVVSWRRNFRRYINKATPKSLFDDLLVSYRRIALHLRFSSGSMFLSGRMSGVNRIFLSSLTYFCLFDQRWSALRCLIALICGSACVIVLAGHLISPMSSVLSRILCLLFQKTRSRCCSNETLVDFWRFLSKIRYCWLQMRWTVFDLFREYS